MAERMSADDRKRILATLEQVSDLVEAGWTPNQAVVKAARAQDLPLGHVTVVAQAFNTGRVNYHRKSAGTVLEKTVSVPLVDLELVQTQLTPNSEKKAATQQQVRAISQDYFQPPDARLSPKLPFPPFPPSLVTPPATPYPPDLEKKTARAFNTLRDYTKVAENARVDLEAARQQLTEAYTIVTEILGRPEACFWKEARENLQATYGPVADRIFTFLEKEYAGRLRKSAQQRSYQPVAGRVASPATPYREMEQLVKKALMFQQAQAQCQSVEEQPEVSVLRQRLYPREQVSKQGAVSEDTAGAPAKAPEAGKKSPGLGAGLLWGLGRVNEHVSTPALDWAISPRSFQKEDDKAFEQLVSPEHELQLRQIRTKAVMHDLLANDPVISEYDPETVLSAFNELQRTSPRLMSEPTFMRTMLRRHLAQAGMDAHELSQLVDSEAKLRQTRELPKGNVPEVIIPPVGVGRGYGRSNAKLWSPILQSLLRSTHVKTEGNRSTESSR